MAEGPQPSPVRQDQRGEGPFLNLDDSLLICASLLLLMPSVASCSGGHAVGGRMGIEDPDIKKGASLAFVPEVLCSDV